MFSRSTLLSTVCIGVMLTMTPAALLAQCGNLANPGFESTTLVPYTTVLVPFTAGYWGQETSSVVSIGACPEVSPYTGSRMLKMSPNAGYTEVFQAVPVGPNEVGKVTASAWFNACDGITPRGTISIRTFNSVNGWPNATSSNSASIELDASASTWEHAVVDCVAIPSDTQWILISLQFPSDELAGKTGYADEVQLVCNCDPVPAERTNWGSIKALYN